MQESRHCVAFLRIWRYPVFVLGAFVHIYKSATNLRKSVMRLSSVIPAKAGIQGWTQ